MQLKFFHPVGYKIYDTGDQDYYQHNNYYNQRKIAYVIYICYVIQ